MKSISKLFILFVLCFNLMGATPISLKKGRFTYSSKIKLKDGNYIALKPRELGICIVAIEASKQKTLIIKQEKRDKAGVMVISIIVGILIGASVTYMVVK